MTNNLSPEARMLDAAEIARRAAIKALRARQLVSTLDAPRYEAFMLKDLFEYLAKNETLRYEALKRGA